jgi:hypothetical protein
MSDIEIAKRLGRYADAHTALEDADDRKLLWLLLNCGLLDERVPFSLADAVLDRIEDKLYPEYDGDKVKIAEYGWETPEGPIIYDQSCYKAGV